MKKWPMFIVLLGASAAGFAADESEVHLKTGAGRELVERSCAVCHSLDYIPMNSPFLDRKGWEGEVNKMIKVMHAPIEESNIPAIVDYLDKYYGKESAASASAPASR